MPNPIPVSPEVSGDHVVVNATLYRWTLDRTASTFEVRDSSGRRAARGHLSPAIAVVDAETGEHRESPGLLSSAEVHDNRLTLVFDGINGSGRAVVEYAFFDKHYALEPIVYSSTAAEHVETALWFARWTEYGAVPGMWAQFYVHPGSTESSALSPVIPSKIRLSITSTIGRGSTDEEAFAQQQWALPLYFWGAYSVDGWGSSKSGLTSKRSDVLVGGLTEIPTGDIHVRYFDEFASPFLRVFGDRWKTHSTRDGDVVLGARFVWTFGPNHREAIRAYYGLLGAVGIIAPRVDSPHKAKVVTMSQFNTWGAQVANDWASADLTQETLELIYDQMSTGGMDPEMFVIDDRWEREYGRLEHDPARFPRFEEFLDRVRGDGRAIGMWAAFIRCQDPESMGLTFDDVLQGPDGTPVTRSLFEDHYYMFDVSRPKVREVLRERAHEFMRRYRPDLVKFDFGYELPSMKFAAPHDRSWGGELILLKSLEVVVSAMREVNPDIAVMYYNLSPLLGQWIDQHSTDDLYLNAGEYGAEVNRRVFFSSLLAEYGVPTYGSGGYDWVEVKDIWFDTVAAGPLGSLNSFNGDQSDSSPTPMDLARYRGLSHLTRRTTAPARIEAIGARVHHGSLTAHAESWARWEQDALTVVALRTRVVDGQIQPVSYADQVHSTVQVAVASLDEAGIALAARLGVVACGPGVVRLRNTRTGSAAATVHAATGSTTLAVRRDGDWLELEVSHLVNGEPIDWIELSID
ncbi:MAG: hypothetical protein LH471_01250 [Salinibacterium sp.]|nr:hypothetical protein [Salinibacterium sp.]